MTGNGADGPRGSARRKHTAQDLLALAALLMTVATAQQLGIPTPLVWVISCVALLLAVLAVFGRQSAAWFRRHRVPAPAPIRALLRKPARTLALLTAGVLLTFGGQYASERYARCEHPVELRVLTSPDTLVPYRRVADAYERHTAANARDCRAVNVYVYAMPSSKVVTAFAQSWSDVPGREPHPDIWFAGSTTEFEHVRRTAEESPSDAVEFEGGGVVAWSPIVLGVPAAAGFSGERLADSWPALVGRVTSAGVGVVRPNPAASAEGQSAMLALYRTSGGLVDPATARSIERQHAVALDAGGYPVDGDTTAVLRRQSEARLTTTAVISSEQALLRFNRTARDLTGDGRPGCDRNDGPPHCLIAYYPKTTPRLEYPFALVRWPDNVANTAAHEPARAFGRWLAEDGGREALNAVGLRTEGREAEPPLSQDNGVLPGPALAAPQAAPTEDVREQAFELYRSARRDGRVLIAVDASGSMNEPVAGGGPRIEVARQGVDRALAHLGPDDEVGLSTFSDDQVRHHVPMGSRTDRAAVQAVLGAVAPAGGTPLYTMITEGVRAVGGGSPDVLSAVIVLTDGEDTTSGLTASQVVDAVRDSGVRVFVVAIGEAGCAGPLSGITDSTGGTCRDADAATVGDDLASLFRQLWGVG